MLVVLEEIPINSRETKKKKKKNEKTAPDLVFAPSVNILITKNGAIWLRMKVKWKEMA